MSSHQDGVDRERFIRDGWIVVPGLFSRGDAAAIADRARSIVERGGGDGVRAGQIQTQFDRRGRARLVKVNQLTASEPLFRELARRSALVDVVEALIGADARIFRDVLIVKPPRSDGVFSYHQDSAYWDVEPRALVSCWIAATDVPEAASCLRVIPGSHGRLRAHGLFIGARRLPESVVDTLRTLVSYAGTGDNPGGAGGNRGLWALKRLVLARATRFAPALSALQDYRALPSEVDLTREVSLPVQSGDVVFFHSLLLHATGPNRTDSARYTPIITYMPSGARFVGKGTPSFPAARQTAA